MNAFVLPGLVLLIAVCVAVNGWLIFKPEPFKRVEPPKRSAPRRPHRNLSS
ncbi:MAG TPA: hypothetical protein VFW13_13610 [Phenylobacterium sp.]|nr:hypothetical protein [Phenylobacterium sp.]